MPKAPSKMPSKTLMRRATARKVAEQFNREPPKGWDINKGIAEFVGGFFAKPEIQIISSLIAPGMMRGVPRGTPKTVKLDGKTIPVKTLPGMDEVVYNYMRARGLHGQQVAAHIPHSKAFGAAVAREFERMPHTPTDPRVLASYEALAKETRSQYDALVKAGYRFEFMKRDAKGNIIDPYAKNPALGYRDLASNKRLQIFPTEAGFGTVDLSASKTNPLLRQSGVKFGDQPATYNDLFRAVHDGFGHFGKGNPFFRGAGEDRAWANHSVMYSKRAQIAVANETRGQNSTVNYGSNAAKNKGASGADTIYADQKAGVLPRWTYETRGPIMAKDVVMMRTPQLAQGKREGKQDTPAKRALVKRPVRVVRAGKSFYQNRWVRPGGQAGGK